MAKAVYKNGVLTYELTESEKQTSQKAVEKYVASNDVEKIVEEVNTQADKLNNTTHYGSTASSVDRTKTLNNYSANLKFLSTLGYDVTEQQSKVKELYEQRSQQLAETSEARKQANRAEKARASQNLSPAGQLLQQSANMDYKSRFPTVSTMLSDYTKAGTQQLAQKISDQLSLNAASKATADSVTAAKTQLKELTAQINELGASYSAAKQRAEVAGGEPLQSDRGVMAQYEGLVKKKESLEVLLNLYERQSAVQDKYASVFATISESPFAKEQKSGLVDKERLARYESPTETGAVSEPKRDSIDRLGVYLNTSAEEKEQAIVRYQEMGTLWGQIMQEGGAGGWSQLKPEEINAYYHLRNTEGQDAADEFLKDYEYILTKRAWVKEQERIDNASGLEKAVMSAGSIPMKMVGAPLAAIDVVGGLVRGGDINPYSPMQTLSNTSGYIREATAKDLDELTGNSAVLGVTAGAAYQALMSGLDSAVGGFTLGPLNSVVLSMDATASKAKELYESGATNEQIAMGAAAAGLAEYVFEKYSIESFLSLDSPKHKKQWFLNALKQGGVEASEEAFTEIANIVSDTLIRGSQSDLNRRIAAYIADGDSTSTASAKAVWDTYAQVYQAAAGGFISGGATSSLSGAFRAVTTAVDSKRIAEIGQLVHDQQELGLLIEGALASFKPGSEAYAFAKDLRTKYVAGKKISDTERGKLYLQVREEQEAQRAKRVEEIKNAEVLAQLAMSSDPATAQAAVAQLQNPEATIVSPVAETLMKAGLKTPVATAQADILDKLSVGRELTAAEVEDLYFASPAVRQEFTRLTGVAVPPGAASTSQKRALCAQATKQVQQRRAQEAETQRAEEEETATQTVQAVAQETPAAPVQPVVEAPAAPIQSVTEAPAAAPDMAPESAPAQPVTPAPEQVPIAAAPEATQVQPQTPVSAEPATSREVSEQALTDLLEQAVAAGEGALVFSDGTSLTKAQFLENAMQKGATRAEAEQQYNIYHQVNLMGAAFPGTARTAGTRSSLNAAVQVLSEVGEREVLPGVRVSRDIDLKARDLAIEWLNNGAAKRFGVKIELADLPDVRDKDGKVTEQKNAEYNSDTHTILLNRKYVTSQYAVTYYFVHEITHTGQDADIYLTKDILSAMKKIYGEKRFESLSQRTRKDYQDAYQNKTDTEREAMIQDEIAANFMMDAIADLKLLDRLTRTRFDIVARFREHLEAVRAGQPADVKAGRKELNRLIDRMAKSMEKATKEKTAPEGGEVRSALSGSDFNEHVVQTALYDALDHEGGRYDNLIRVSSMPLNIVERFGIEGDLYLQRNHAYENMVSREQAIQDGRAVTRKGEDIHFHDHGIEKMTNAILSIDDPTLAFSVKSKTGNPTVVMILSEFGKNGAPLYAVLSFYSDKSLNGNPGLRPHVVLTIAERDFFGKGGRVGYNEIIHSAIKDGRVLMYNKKRGNDLSVIANPAGVGNITASFLEKNLAQFRKEVKAFKEKNKIRHSLSPTTGYEEGTIQDRTLQLLQTGTLDEAVSLLQRWAEDVRAGKVEAKPEEAALRDQLLKAEPVTPEQAAANRDKLNQLIEKYGEIKPGMNRSRPVFLPKYTGEDTAVSKFARTLAEAEGTPTWFKDEIERAVADNNWGFTHTIATDKAAMAGLEREKRSGYAHALNKWNAIVNTRQTDPGALGFRTGLITKNDIALGEWLYMETVKAGDVAGAMKIAAELAAIGTQAGQAVQAMSLLKKMSPSGQLYYLMKAVDRLNQSHNEQISKGRMDEITIRPELAEAVLNAKNPEEIKSAMDALLQDIADQVPPTFMEMWNSWRYLSMLGNPVTHARNFFSNVVMAPVVFAKDMLAAIGEVAVKQDSKTKNLGQALASSLYGVRIKATPYIQYASKDAKRMQEVLSGGGKHNVQDMIRDKRKPFGKSRFAKPFNAASEFNSKWLEKEDWAFLDLHYTRSLSQYLAAQKADLDTLETTPEGRNLLERARAYAIQEAQKATFRDASQLANALSQFERSGVAGRLIVGAVMPFKKTPINILKRGVEYSPLGIFSTVKHALKKESTAAEFVDGLAASLTGTAIMWVGHYLFKQGLLRGGGSDDEKENAYEELMGEQAYSLKLANGGNYTLSWMSPAALPLFIGAEFAKLQQEAEESGENFQFGKLSGDVLWTLAEPLFQMTMLDGLRSTLKSASYGNNEFASVLQNMATSYFGQAIPTALKRAMQIVDGARRTTYIDPDSPLPAWLDRFWQSSVQPAIPGKADDRTAYVDAWGRTDDGGSLGLRIIENVISPGYVSMTRTTPTDDELLRLYQVDSEADILPRSVPVSFTKDKVKYELNAEQWTTYQTVKGQTAYNLITEFMNSPVYQTMTDDQRIEAVEDIWTYADEQGRAAALPDYKIDTTWIVEADALASSGVAVTDTVALSILDEANKGQSKQDILSMDWLSDEQKGDVLLTTKLTSLAKQQAFSDPNKEKFEYVMTDAQQQEYLARYKELWASEYGEVLKSSAYQNMTDAEKAEFLGSLESNVVSRTNEWMAGQMSKAGVKSTATASFSNNALQNCSEQEELIRLYNLTQDSGVLPSTSGMTIQDKPLTATQSLKYREKEESTRNALLTDVISSKAYKSMDTEQKVAAVKKVLKYAEELGKAAAIKGYTSEGAWVKKAQNLSAKGVAVETYIAVLAEQTTDGNLEDRLSMTWLSDEDRGLIIGEEYEKTLTNNGTTFTDPTTTGYQYVMTSAQAERFVEHFDVLWESEYSKLVNQQKYQSADIEGKAEMIRDLRTEVAKDTKKWMEIELNREGIRSVKKK